MRYQFEECIERGKIVRITPDPDLVRKELREASADLRAAERSLAEHLEKWAIIQGYYSMFHALRPRVFALGYREKSHRCLKYAIEALLVDTGTLDRDVLDQFSFAIRIREGADYGNVYDAQAAEVVVASARRICERVTPS